MARTSDVLVKKILGDNYGKLRDGTLPDLTPFIDSSSAVVDNLVAKAAARGNGISSPVAELIERNLAAHYYVQMDPMYSSKSANGASGSFRDQSYKEMAIDLDPSRLLIGILNRKTATIGWVGPSTYDSGLTDCD